MSTKKKAAGNFHQINGNFHQTILEGASNLLKSLSSVIINVWANNCSPVSLMQAVLLPTKFQERPEIQSVTKKSLIKRDFLELIIKTCNKNNQKPKISTKLSKINVSETF